MLQITKLSNSVPAGKKTNDPIMYKPHLKVYRNAVEMNHHLKKLLDIKIGDGVCLGFATDEETGEQFLIVYADSGSSIVLGGSPADKWMYGVDMPPDAIWTVIKTVAKFQRIELNQLPYPFYLTTGEKHKIELWDADMPYSVYRLKFESIKK